jgi:hypothetical protein
MFKSLWLRIIAFVENKWFSRRIEMAKGDFLPPKMPKRNLVLVRDGKEDWSVGFICPCGCNRTIELLLVNDAKPRWDLAVDVKGRPTLTPSVWLNDGCRSHFWVRCGKVIWCD